MLDKRLDIEYWVFGMYILQKSINQRRNCFFIKRCETG